MAVAVATAKAAAGHLGEADAAAVQLLYELALRVDERKPTDNVSLPTALKLVEALGLTPLARGELAPRGKPEKGATGDGGEGDRGDEGAAESEFERRRRAAQSKLGGAKAR